MAPRFEEIKLELAAVSSFRDKPAGSIRLTASEHAANHILWPKLSAGLADYPDIRVEVCVDYTLTDIVAQCYDAGVRLGGQVARDMIAVPISAPMRMAEHCCINLRLPTYGGLMQWEFEKDGREIRARGQGQWTFNSSGPLLRAALAGCGLAYIPDDMAAEHIAQGHLLRVLDDWCEPFPGYHLYYPNRRQPSLTLGVVIDLLRHR